VKFANQNFPAILLIVVVAIFSGCGGGSGGPAATPSGIAKIDATNAEAIAGAVVDGVFASGSFSDVLEGGGSGGLLGKTDDQLSKATGSQFAGMPGFFASVPIPGTTIECFVDGMVTVSGQLADPTTLSAGDRIMLQFSQCDDGAGQVVNGIYEIVINSISGDLPEGLVDLDATVTFDGFEVLEVTEMTSLNGVFTLQLDTSVPAMTSISVSGTSVSVSDNTHSATLSAFQTDLARDGRVIPEAYTLVASGTLSSTLFEGTVNYSTPVSFLGAAGQYPYQGELLVAGADGSSVRLVALDNMNVRLEIDPGDGSGIVIQETIWGTIASASVLIGEDNGIMGTVLRGPINPGPEIEGEVNQEPFRALFHVLHSDHVVAHFESDDDGNFRVVLVPGEYRIVADASAPLLNPELQPKLVTVPENGFADVTLEFDTGIR
jgi:hypothetical protein